MNISGFALFLLFCGLALIGLGTFLTVTVCRVIFDKEIAANLPYRLDQKVIHLDRGAMVDTYVWYEGNIVYSSYKDIDSDSTSLKEKEIALNWIKMMKKNNQE